MAMCVVIKVTQMFFVCECTCFINPFLPLFSCKCAVCVRVCVLLSGTALKPLLFSSEVILLFDFHGSIAQKCFFSVLLSSGISTQTDRQTDRCSQRRCKIGVRKNKSKRRNKARYGEDLRGGVRKRVEQMEFLRQRRCGPEE